LKGAVFYKKGDLRVEDIEIRKPKSYEVTLKVEYCGVCGTDKHILAGAEGAGYTPPGTVLGHEFSGIITEVGENVKGIAVGDRVCVDPNDMCGKCYYCKQGIGHFCEDMIGIGTTVNGGFAEFCTVNAKQVYKIPDSLSLKEAAMAEPVACCLHGMDLINMRAGQTVMIIGGGTIGMIMLQLAKASGASTLIMIEPVESKRKMASKFGADITIDPFNDRIEEALAKAGVKQIDTTIECVGLVKTMNMAIDFTGKGGTAMLFGLTEPDSEMIIKPFDLFKREITVKASYINPYTQMRAINLLSSGIVDVNSLITDIVGLDNINDVFMTDKYKNSGKILIKP